MSSFVVLFLLLLLRFFLIQYNIIIFSILQVYIIIKNDQSEIGINN